MLKTMKPGDTLKVFGIVLSIFLLVVLGMRIFSLGRQANTAEKNFSEFKSKLEQAKTDQDKIAADVNYYLNPDNLKKELKGRFNYKEVGEKMVIFINRNPSSTTSSSPR